MRNGSDLITFFLERIEPVSHLNKENRIMLE